MAWSIPRSNGVGIKLRKPVAPPLAPRKYLWPHLYQLPLDRPSSSSGFNNYDDDSLYADGNGDDDSIGEDIEVKDNNWKYSLLNKE